MHSFLRAMFPMAELFTVRAAEIAVNIRSPCGCDTSQQSVDLSVFNLSASFVYRTHTHTHLSFLLCVYQIIFVSFILYSQHVVSIQRRLGVGDPLPPTLPSLFLLL